MTYRDQTFCHDWCTNEACFRNYKHVQDAQQEGGFLQQNPWMPVAFFVDIPMDCKERIPKETPNGQGTT